VRGDEGAALLRIVRQLAREMGSASGRRWPAAASLGTRSYLLPGTDLGPQEEDFVAAMRAALAEVAEAAGAGSLAQPRERAVIAALDGAELVTRGQLAVGRPEQLRGLLPSFIFLLALPIMQQNDALATSERARNLIEEAFGPLQ
jgi:hypothetical protein